MSEFIYILENTLMPGLVKIGRTERSVSERVGKLSSHTGVPTSFTVEKPSYEMAIHQQLSKPASIESGIDENEELVQQCIEVIRSEQKASVSLLQRRLRLGYTRAQRIMDELEGRGIVGPSKGAEPRDILIDLDDGATDHSGYSGGSTPPVSQLTIIQPNMVICLCEHCAEKIEFDANELGDRQSVSVPCPHCGVETVLLNPGD